VKDSNPYFDLCINVVRRVESEPWTHELGLIWMALLHTHKITWSPGVVSDGPNTWHGLTNRGTSAVVAAQWPPGSPESDPTFWYYKQLEDHWETYEGLPPAVRTRVDGLAKNLPTDDRIVKVEPDDD
jgi:hypothetical protein